MATHKVERQAVVIIHGIGEQRPMDTLRGFVEAVWSSDAAVQNEHVMEYAGVKFWSKPDGVSDSFELRRLTAPENKAGIRTDFFEFYWQHLMQGTEYGHVFAWAITLLWRRPNSLPPQLRLAYWVLWFLTLFAMAALLLGGMFWRAWGQTWWLAGTLNLLGLGLLYAAAWLAKGVIGDAARYLHVAPSNVQCRHEIRQAGVRLLQTLHERGYDRIVVVGHSLGSVIAYDVLTYAWVAYHQGKGSPEVEMAALEELEKHARGETPKGVTFDLHAKQREYLAELAKAGVGWRVTDLVTLGSPLAHADILLAHDGPALAAKQRDREFPTCPPALETSMRDRQRVQRFSFESERRNNRSYRWPHHAAVFAPTRWTNLYFPARLLLFGDLVGGPLAGLFGAGVRDQALHCPSKNLLLHTHYWTKDCTASDHLRELREAVNLLDR